jgi:hypothetical protein
MPYCSRPLAPVTLTQLFANLPGRNAFFSDIAMKFTQRKHPGRVKFGQGVGREN